MTPLFLGNISFGEILLIALIVLLIFGGKKIPELMRGLGRGVRSFKEGMNETETAAKETVDDAVKDTAGTAEDAAEDVPAKYN